MFSCLTALVGLAAVPEVMLDDVRDLEPSLRTLPSILLMVGESEAAMVALVLTVVAPDYVLCTVRTNTECCTHQRL